MRPTSKPLRVGSGRRVVSVRRAVPERLRPSSHYFTISFGGPGAMEYFSSLMAQLSHCSYKMRSTGNMHEISLDDIPAKSLNRPTRGERT